LVLESHSDMHLSQEIFLFRMRVALTITQMTLLAQNSHSGLTVQAVLYLKSAGLEGVPGGYDRVTPHQ
jgi:hypothetical protein